MFVISCKFENMFTWGGASSEIANLQKGKVDITGLSVAPKESTDDLNKSVNWRTVWGSMGPLTSMLYWSPSFPDLINAPLT